MRTFYQKLRNGVILYKVKLEGGPYDGVESLCSGDVVFHQGEKYVRDAEDHYKWVEKP